MPAILDQLGADILDQLGSAILDQQELIVTAALTIEFYVQAMNSARVSTAFDVGTTIQTTKRIIAEVPWISPYNVI